MASATSLFLIDGDFRRRAAISHCLAGSEIHFVQGWWSMAILCKTLQSCSSENDYISS